MKKIKQLFVLGLSCLLTNFGYSQIPQGFKYQAVARDGTTGSLLASQTIDVDFIIYEGTVAPINVAYQESHSAMTNQYGLFSVVIGQGTPAFGTFSNITWSNGEHHLRVDVNGSILGTSQLVTVPYAFYAETSGSGGGGSDDQNLTLSGNILSIEDGNSVTLTDNVDDVDADTTNELQQLSLAGTTLSITNGNSVNLNSINSGSVSGSGNSNQIAKFINSGLIGNSQIQDNGIGIGIGGTPFSDAKLFLETNLNYGAIVRTTENSSAAIAAISFGTSGLTYGLEGRATDSPSGRGVAGLGGYIGVDGTGNTYDFYASGSGLDYGTASSVRWKENITQIDNPLEKVQKLRGVYYDWKKQQGGRHDIGFIAEEVGLVLPEIVAFENDGSGYASGMDYSKIGSLLVEAIKEQQMQIEAMRQQIEFLTKQIAGSAGSK